MNRRTTSPALAAVDAELRATILMPNPRNRRARSRTVSRRVLQKPHRSRDDIGWQSGMAHGIHCLRGRSGSASSLRAAPQLTVSVTLRCQSGLTRTSRRQRGTGNPASGGSSSGLTFAVRVAPRLDALSVEVWKQTFPRAPYSSGRTARTRSTARASARAGLRPHEAARLPAESELAARPLVSEPHEGRPAAPHVRPDARHTFASSALEAGEAPSWVAVMLGHPMPRWPLTVSARSILNGTRLWGRAVVGGLIPPPAPPRPQPYSRRSLAAPQR